MAELLAFWQKADIITPLALRVAATLRLADHIAAGADRLSDLAAKSGAEEESLGRLLRYLIARGVFTQPSPGRYAVNDWAEFLRDSHPSGTRAWLDLEGFGGRMDLAFVDLLTAIRTGRPPRRGDEAGMNEAERTSFDDLMETQNRAQAPAIAAAYDWSRFRHVVDVGGGSGALLSEILRGHPGARGSLVELPETAEKALALFAKDHLAERTSVVAGDLFEVMPRGGDVYILKFILHGFADAKAVEILRRARDAGSSDARLLVIERTVAPGEDPGQFTAMDLRMLILNEGRERTLDQYGALARQAGLAVAGATPTPVGVSMIEMRPETTS
jgi:hypothetical protein